MANTIHVKKGDTVVVLSGKDKGKKGKILGVKPAESRVLVEGVNMVTKHVKPKSRYQQGGLVHQEGAIHSSNVMIICEKCGRASKISRKVLENGEKARVCKKCNEVIDIVSKSEE